jgi:PAS domain S-box-containing protein
MTDANDPPPGSTNGDDELARLREIFAQSPSFSALLHGPDYRFVLSNPAYQQLVGRPVIGRTVREAFPEVESQGFLALLDDVRSTGNPYVGRDVEIVFQPPEGGPPETRFLDFVYQPIKDAVGKVASIFVEGSDQTQRHATETALRESEAHLRALNLDLERQVIQRAQARSLTWQLSPDLLGALNDKGYFETSNPAWQTVLGWSEAEVASTPIFELLHPDDLEHTRAGFELVLVGQPALRFVNRYRCKDGSYRWISWIGIQEDGFVYCTGRDVTVEKIAEMELAEAQEALRQSQKMEAIGHLTGGIAHDFNNLLTGILGSLDLARRRMATGTRAEDIPRFMDAATTSAQRAAALTHRLLAFARRQSLDSRPNNVNRLIGSIEDLLRRTLGERIELHSELAADLWTVFTDANQLENAILNLAINSRDAMPDGGTLTITTANAQLAETYTLQHEGLEPGDYVVIRVADTGIGMPAEVVARATDPFFTTKQVGEGTGLGLSMISGFARQSRGHLHIDSQVGQGTTVELYLPRALQDAIELNVPIAIAPRGKGETILVVEDDTTVRSIITDVLEELGYLVFSAPDARAAIPMLQSNQPIHLMVSDVVLPHINGRKLAEVARAARPGLKVLFVSGYAEEATLRTDFLDSGMDMMTKPFALDALGAKVRMLIEQKADPSPAHKS